MGAGARGKGSSLAEASTSHDLAQGTSSSGALRLSYSRKDVAEEHAEGLDAAHRKRELDALLFPSPAGRRLVEKAAWTVSSSGRRFPAIAWRKGHLPGAMGSAGAVGSGSGASSSRARKSSTSPPRARASAAELLRQVSRNKQKGRAQPGGFKDAGGHAIDLPHFSGTGDALRNAIVMHGDISFRLDSEVSAINVAGRAQGVARADGSPARGRGHQAAWAKRRNQEQEHRRGTAEDSGETTASIRVRVPGKQSVFDVATMPGYYFVRDLDSSLDTSYPALALLVDYRLMALPSSRQETLLLADWTERSVENVRSANASKIMRTKKLRKSSVTRADLASGNLNALENAQAMLEWKEIDEAQVLSMAMADMVRQVGAHCAERGALLAHIWNSTMDVLENRIKYLEDTSARLEAKSSVLIAEAPRLKKQSQLYKDATLRAEKASERSVEAETRAQKSEEYLKKVEIGISKLNSLMKKVDSYIGARMSNLRWQKAVKISTKFNFAKKRGSWVDTKTLELHEEVDSLECLASLDTKLTKHLETLKEFEQYAVSVAKSNAAVSRIKIAANLCQDLQKSIEETSLAKEKKVALEQKLNMFTSGSMEELEQQISESLVDLSPEEIGKLLMSVSAKVAAGALNRLQHEQVAQILSTLSPVKAAEIMESMNPINVASAAMVLDEQMLLKLLQHTSPSMVSKVLTCMAPMHAEGAEYATRLASDLVMQSDDLMKRVTLLEHFNNKDAVFALQQLDRHMQVEIINEIDTENAIRLLLYSNKTVEVLASLLSKCDEEKVSNILECMINESNKNFDKRQKSLACQVMIAFDPDFAANVILCTASISRRAWPEASTWTHICEKSIFEDDEINLEGSCIQIVLALAKKNIQKAAFFIMKIRDRQFAADILSIMLSSFLGGEDKKIAHSIMIELVTDGSHTFDPIAIIQMFGMQKSVAETIVHKSIESDFIGEAFSKSVIEHVPASQVVQLINRSAVNAMDIAKLMKRVHNSEVTDAILKGFEPVIKELVATYMNESDQKPNAEVPLEPAKVVQKSPAPSPKPIIRPKSSQKKRFSLLSSPPQTSSSARKSSPPLGASRTPPRTPPKSKVAEKLMDAIPLKNVLDDMPKPSTPERQRASPAYRPKSVSMIATTKARDTEISKVLKEVVAKGQRRRSLVDQIQLKALQEKVLGRHRRQWMHQNAALKVALAQASETKTGGQRSAAAGQNLVRIQHLLRSGKERSGEWLSRMVEMILQHLVEHYNQQKTSFLIKQLTSVTATQIQRASTTFVPNSFDNLPLELKLKFMSGSTRVVSWTMSEAVTGFFNKQYGTGHIVDEYIGSVLISLKSKFHDPHSSEDDVDFAQRPVYKIIWNLITDLWGGDVLARFVNAMSAIDAFVQASFQRKASSLWITSLNYGVSSKWLCRRRAQIIADAVLGSRSKEARKVFEERIDKIAVPVEEDEEEDHHLQVVDSDERGITDLEGLSKAFSPDGTTKHAWKVPKSLFLWQLCMEANHYEKTISKAILSIWRSCDQDNNGYVDKGEAEVMLRECIEKLDIQSQILKVDPTGDNQEKPGVPTFESIFEQFWSSAVLVDESCNSTPPSAIGVIEKLVMDAQKKSGQTSTKWVLGVGEISFTGFTAAVRMSPLVRSYIQIFHTKPRDFDYSYEDIDPHDIFENAGSNKITDKDATLTLVTKRHTKFVKDRLHRIFLNCGESEPLLRGLFHRIEEDQNGPNISKLYLKMLQEIDGIQINKLRDYMILKTDPPDNILRPGVDDEGGDAGQDATSLEGFHKNFDAGLKQAEQSMLILSGCSLTDILKEEITEVTKRSKVQDMVQLVKGMGAAQRSLRDGLLRLAVRRRVAKMRENALTNA